MRLRIAITAAMAVAALGATATAQDLQVGDKAPEVSVETWVKNGTLGETGFTGFQEGKVYLVEFWATWCGPCKASIPHLTELQDRYGDKGLVILGISTDQDTEKVEPFVKSMGARMGYTVGIDYRGRTKSAYMDAFGAKGIPQFYLVDGTGTIVLEGNPHPRADAEKLEQVLKKVLRGRYDPKLEAKAGPAKDGARLARRTRNWRQALALYDDVIDLKPAIFVETSLERFDMMLVDMRDREAAYAYLQELIDDVYKNDPGALQMIAEHLATSTTLETEHRDLDVALVAAQSAADKLGARDPQALAGVAYVRFYRGEIEEALDLQRRAWMMAKPRDKTTYKRHLDMYLDARTRANMP